MAQKSTTPDKPTATTTPAGRPRPTWWVRLIALGAVVLTAWHVFASFLWIAPPSPLREIPGQQALSAYMLPMFGQSWSVFAPEPINGDYHFNVRAVMKKDGQEVTTGWVSATDVEISMIRYNLFPPRAGIQSTEVASGQMNAYNKLTAKQKALIVLDYTSEGWEAWMKKSFAKLGEGDAGVADYLHQEHRAVAYATQVAYAMWGADEVEKVQYRVSRQNIVPFADRNKPGAQRPAPTFSTTGWRLPIEEKGQSREDFASVFRAQYDRTQK